MKAKTKKALRTGIYVRVASLYKNHAGTNLDFTGLCPFFNFILARIF